MPSVMNQTYQHWEMLVLGDGCSPYHAEVAETFARLDPRVSFVNLPRQDYPADPISAWLISGSGVSNYGLDHAGGDWVCWCGDDDEMLPTYIETLLGEADRQRVDAIYCPVEVVGATFDNATVVDGKVVLGSWPPYLAGQTYPLLVKKNPVRFDTECWREGLPNDWDYWTRLMEAGVKFGFYPEPLFRFHPSARAARYV